MTLKHLDLRSYSTFFLCVRAALLALRPDNQTRSRTVEAAYGQRDECQGAGEEEGGGNRSGGDLRQYSYDS